MYTEMISDFIDRKLRTSSTYAQEILTFSPPLSSVAAEHLERRRGATIGRAASEAFMLGRAIV